MGSVGLLLFKEFFMKDLSWSRVLMQFSYLQFCLGLLLLAISNIYFDKYRGGRDRRKWYFNVGCDLSRAVRHKKEVQSALLFNSQFHLFNIPKTYFAILSFYDSGFLSRCVLVVCIGCLYFSVELVFPLAGVEAGNVLLMVICFIVVRECNRAGQCDNANEGL